MTKNKLSVLSRVLITLASLALIAVFFLPAWRIDLFAPQYPEGLTMNIWINGLTGDVDIINGLNHYIGMKHITVDMFPEFSYLKYVVLFFMAFGLIVAITGRRKLLFAYLLLTIIGGALAMYDFYSWGYDYGHNLDPTAPIQVPGLSYQPPLLGHKRLLNFDAYSLPDAGGWIVITAGILAFVVWALEWYRHRKVVVRPGLASFLIASQLLIIASCNTTTPEPFQIGKDNCYFCKMSITDSRYGGEIITKKGKVYKFDDLHCMIQYLKSGAEKEANISKKLAVNFEKENQFIDIEAATFVVSGELKSPMGSNAAAFINPQAAANFIGGKTAETTGWQQLYNKVQ